MDEMMLTMEEAADLKSLEARVEVGLATFVDVGLALIEIRERRLYRAMHRTFETYCRDRWGMAASRARQLIAAANVVRDLETVTTVTPANERVARCLAPLPPEQRAEVWREAVETAPGGVVTAAHVERVRETMTGYTGATGDSRMAEILDLDAKSHAALQRGDEAKWDQAERVASLLDHGLSPGQIAARWWNVREGKWYTPTHVLLTASAFRMYGALRPRPNLDDAYQFWRQARRRGRTCTPPEGIFPWSPWTLEVLYGGKRPDWPNPSPAVEAGSTIPPRDGAVAP